MFPLDFKNMGPLLLQLRGWFQFLVSVFSQALDRCETYSYLYSIDRRRGFIFLPHSLIMIICKVCEVIFKYFTTGVRTWSVYTTRISITVIRPKIALIHIYKTEKHFLIIPCIRSSPTGGNFFAGAESFVWMCNIFFIQVTWSI